MKFVYSSLFLFCMILNGCSTVTNHVATGRDFDETKVTQIKKGVTTADGIVALYGEPDRKDIVSPQQVMWHYSYLTEEHKTRSAMFSPVVERTTGFKKNLDVLLENDIVINFTYVKVPIESQTETSSGFGN
jgi:outer membrane protein assembly factor BamE (lipoprotein component of BamABCDE complex)